MPVLIAEFGVSYATIALYWVLIWFAAAAAAVGLLGAVLIILQNASSHRNGLWLLAAGSGGFVMGAWALRQIPFHSWDVTLDAARSAPVLALCWVHSGRDYFRRGARFWFVVGLALAASCHALLFGGDFDGRAMRLALIGSTSCFVGSMAFLLRREAVRRRTGRRLLAPTFVFAAGFAALNSDAIWVGASVLPWEIPPITVTAVHDDELGVVIVNQGARPLRWISVAVREPGVVTQFVVVPTLGAKESVKVRARDLFERKPLGNIVRFQADGFEGSVNARMEPQSTGWRFF